MTARPLFHLLDAVYLLALLAWCACLIAASRPRARPGLAVLGATAGAVALASFTSGVLLMPEFRGGRSLVQILLILAGLLTMLGLANRRGGEGRVGWVLVGGLVVMTVLLVARATRPAPTSAGIVEPTIEERARLRFEQARREAEAEAEP